MVNRSTEAITPSYMSCIVNNVVVLVGAGTTAGVALGPAGSAVGATMGVIAGIISGIVQAERNAKRQTTERERQEAIERRRTLITTASMLGTASLGFSGIYASQCQELLQHSVCASTGGVAAVAALGTVVALYQAHFGLKKISL